MATLFQFQQRLARINNIAALESILFLEIKKNEKAFIELNKAQLSEGKDNKGKVFGKYTQLTEDIAKTENPRKPKVAGQPYNFEYTGGLFDGFELPVDGTQAQFFSTDGKTEELFLKYDGLFGLQPENLRTVIKETILPAFLIQIRKELKLL
jgi:hypothetical protein